VPKEKPTVTPVLLNVLATRSTRKVVARLDMEELLLLKHASATRCTSLSAPKEKPTVTAVWPNAKATRSTRKVDARRRSVACAIERTSRFVPKEKPTVTPVSLNVLATRSTRKADVPRSPEGLVGVFRSNNLVSKCLVFNG